MESGLKRRRTFGQRSAASALELKEVSWRQKTSDFSIIYFIVALTMMFVAQYFLLAKQIETISYSQFKTLLKKGQVAEVVVRDKTIGGSIKSEGLKEIFTAEKIKDLGESAKKPVPFLAVRVDDPRLTAELEEAGIPFKGEPTNDWLPTLLSWIVPIVLFLCLWNFLMSRMGGGASWRFDADRQEQGEGLYREIHRRHFRRCRGYRRSRR